MDAPQLATEKGKWAADQRRGDYRLRLRPPPRYPEPPQPLLSITDSALGYMSLEDMLSELLERIRSSLEVDTAAVLLLDEDRGVLVARAARGLEEEVRQGVQVPLARGFAGRVAARRVPSSSRISNTPRS